MQIEFYSIKKMKLWTSNLSKQKRFQVDLKIKLCEKILYPTENV